MKTRAALAQGPSAQGLLAEGLRLWLTVFTAALLTTALLAAPKLAGEGDFGHVHPEGTPEHVHNLSGVLGSALQVTPPVATEAALSLVCLLEPVCLERGIRLSTRQQARAPPQES